MSSAKKTLNLGFFLARKFLTATSFGAFAWTTVAHAGVSQPTYPKSDLLLVTTVINATNPYMASWIQGSKDLAAKLGVPLEVVQSNGSSQTELAGIQAQWPKNASRSDDPLFAERASQARPLKANAYESIASRSKRTTIKPLFVRRLLCPAILALSIRPGLYANIIFFRMAYGCVCGTMPLYATQLTSANFKILKRT